MEFKMKTGNAAKIVFLTIFCLLVTFLGTITFFVYFFNYGMNDETGRNLSGVFPGFGLEKLIGRSGTIVLEQDDKTALAVKETSSALVGIFRKKNFEEKEIFSLIDYYDLSNEAAEGLAVTNDGWIIAGGNLGTEENLKNNFVVITRERKIYPIEGAILDKEIGIYFIRIAARDLSVRGFAENSEISEGRTVLGVNWKNFIFISNISKSSDSETYFSSDDNAGKITLSRSIDKTFFNSFIFGLSGNVAGFINSKGEVYRPENLSSALKGILKYGVLKHPYLGVNYIDLENVAGFMLKQGAVISAISEAPAVAKGGPAASAGLREGDIIVYFDGTELNQENKLADLVKRHVPGDSVEIEYWRGKEKKTAVVILGEE